MPKPRKLQLKAYADNFAIQTRRLIWHSPALFDQFSGRISARHRLTGDVKACGLLQSRAGAQCHAQGS